MSHRNAQAPSTRFPSDSYPDRGAALRSLQLLSNWRAGAAASAIVIGGLLPFAIAWHVSYLIATTTSLIAAAARQQLGDR